MATITLKVSPGESVKLWPAARCEPAVRHGGNPPGAPVDTQVASGAGVVTFTQPSRIEFYAQRASGAFVKVMDSTTRYPPL